MKEQENNLIETLTERFRTKAEHTLKLRLKSLAISGAQKSGISKLNFLHIPSNLSEKDYLSEIKVHKLFLRALKETMDFSSAKTVTLSVLDKISNSQIKFKKTF